MKANGMMSGCSDLIMLYKGKVIFIEVKSEKGKQSDTQKAFEKLVNSEGHHYILVRSFNDAYEKIQGIFTNKK